MRVLECLLERDYKSSEENLSNKKYVNNESMSIKVHLNS